MPLESVAIAAGAFIYGAVFGSFANVVIHRLPRGEPLARPSSRCPGCGKNLNWWENVPLISYVGLKGRCSACGVRISVRYPLVEALCGGLWALTAVTIGLTPYLAALLAMVTTLTILTFIDLEHRRLPNRVLGPAAVIAVGCLCVASLVTGEPSSLLDSAIGAAAYGGPMLLIALAVPRGMGGGDVKLGAYIGLNLAWEALGNVAVAAFVAVLAGGVVSLILMASGTRGRKDAIPFGPFMALGAVVGALWGPQLLEIWLATAGF